MNPAIQAVLKAKAELLAYAAVPAEAYRSVAAQFAELRLVTPPPPSARKG